MVKTKEYMRSYRGTVANRNGVRQVFDNAIARYRESVANGNAAQYRADMLGVLEAARSLMDNPSRYNELWNDENVTRLVFALRDAYGNDFANNGIYSNIQSVQTEGSRENPFLDADSWVSIKSRAQRALKELHDKGFTDYEIAALLRFENDINAGISGSRNG